MVINQHKLIDEYCKYLYFDGAYHFRNLMYNRILLYALSSQI